jgi:hypothetical protein
MHTQSAVVALHQPDFPSHDIQHTEFCTLYYMRNLQGSRDSSVGIATGYGLEDGGVGVRVPAWQECSLLHVVQTGSGVHPTSYTMGTGGGLSSGVKRPEREADHHLKLVTRSRKCGSIHPLLHTPSWRTV